MWVSGDLRHGLLLDLYVDDELIIKSDETFKVMEHSGYKEIGVVGYQTGYMEEYNSNSADAFYYMEDFDDSSWAYAKERKYIDYILERQEVKLLNFEYIKPVSLKRKDYGYFIDFGSIFVGELLIKAKGSKNQLITIHYGQELNDDGRVRFNLRSNCDYEEKWILSGMEDSLDLFDYKSFRYVDLVFNNDIEIIDVKLKARHYPFKENTKLKNELNDLKDIFELASSSLKYGVQDVIQDCMDREKGFYVGDGCYSALTHMILTGDSSICKKLIKDALHSTFITPSTVTCLDCSFMQEIAEYPLILISLVAWYYNYTKDIELVRESIPKMKLILDSYKEEYENDYLLSNLDKWCVVEWPKNFQHGYAVDINEGKVCIEPHIAINAYYFEAINTLNYLFKVSGLNEYRDSTPIKNKILNTFYDNDKHLFNDGIKIKHTSYVGNIFAYAFNLFPLGEDEKMLEMIEENGLSSVLFFAGFPLMKALMEKNKEGLLYKFIGSDKTYRRMIKEGATRTFEGWGKDVKWNTSLFHLTLCDCLLFIMDIDIKKIFNIKL